MPAAYRHGPREAKVPFSGLAIDRVATLRQDSSWVADALEQPSTRVVSAGRDGVLLSDGEPPALARRAIGGHADAFADPILLGLEDGAAIFALDLETLAPDALACIGRGSTMVGLREAGTLLPQPEGGLAAYLVALLNWHRGHRFCANCGMATVIAEAGYSRRCKSCATLHFPRTDPVVIMIVENGERLLLGRHARWPQRQYSALSGFVSPGESVEEAVAREVREEADVDAYEPRLVASQPWPFPSSLMLGFQARSDGGEPSTGDGELEDVRWFGLDTVRAALSDHSSELRLPAKVSIARFLIESWVAGLTPD